ncbi:glycoprotein-N-acetylgalactosamine 3-beta-galactosyltransferase 1-like, partial [Portunus trituberculatus]|uniref:glycoprotein-N-acetylgalactosamine 3-beta-galactosyltransferase 1-like n=1 Tax=Portunus trituberculatus TaxID=210409 RepID=UPI001E1CED2C
TTTTTTPALNASHAPARPHKVCHNTVAEKLMRDVKILCLVVTFPAHHVTHALPVHRTWGKRCTQTIFITNTDTERQGKGEKGKKRVDIDKGVVLQPEDVSELFFMRVPDTSQGRDGLWNKTKFAFTYAHEFYINDFDWFVKADDDTYFIMENLRYWLHDKDQDEKLFYGLSTRHIYPRFLSGGAGYVLSRGALREFQKVTSTTNATGYFEEDLQMASVLAAGGVFPGDLRDRDGRPLFFPLDPAYLMEPREKDHSFWYWQMLAHDHPTGVTCCSSHAISFHYITGAILYQLEFFIYHLKLFGVGERTGVC